MGNVNSETTPIMTLGRPPQRKVRCKQKIAELTMYCPMSCSHAVRLAYNISLLRTMLVSHVLLVSLNLDSWRHREWAAAITQKSVDLVKIQWER